ncbi:arylsulfatase I-like [Helicoverpa zea]|uniref:arylsulfatase I-like n=1 Tax=Helicoverpa zea TaxID=7113 RepID=UPI001F5930E7|nr:arylsulfatase I-like [Helicoverpa zea]
MLLFVSVCLVLCWAAAEARPNIIIILADDLGWNDVGFHGMNQIPTPNIDALAYSGIILQNYYVNSMCTPSRAALMTGKYPIHTGMQHSAIRASEPWGLPLSEKLLPQFLKELGYKTHLVGKWHLGHYKKAYLPMNRGFDTHLGTYGPKIDLYDHTNMDLGTWGFDFWRGFEHADDLFGQYATDIYTEEAIKVVKAHNKSEPLFLMVSHSAMHSGNPSEYLRAPDEVIDRFQYINDTQRRKYAGMLAKLDESVGMVVKSLQEYGLLENSIILFSTDNGGAARCDHNVASNHPLKGVKNTLWEGGVRGAALLWSPVIKYPSRVANQTFHLVDWLPTLYSAAGGNISVFENIDGFNSWEALINDLPSQRTKIVHNIDDVYGSAAITVDNWKLLKGTNFQGRRDDWFGPTARDGAYNIDTIYNSSSAEAIGKIAKMPTKDNITRLKEESTIKCNDSIPITPCDLLKAPCLYDIMVDPCEKQNLASGKPEVLQALLLELDKVNKTAVPPLKIKPVPEADPKHWGRLVTTFGEANTSLSIVKLK